MNSHYSHNFNRVNTFSVLGFLILLGGISLHMRKKNPLRVGSKHIGVFASDGDNMSIEIPVMVAIKEIHWRLTNIIETIVALF